jgi:predicted nucleic acid-binding protein
MNTLVGVIDASMVIGLAKGNVLDLLQYLYQPLYVTTDVREEVITESDLPGAAELTQALGRWITEITPDPSGVQMVSASLSPADRGVLAVAIDPARAIDHVLTGDAQLYREAERQGRVSLSVTDVVVFLKQEGLITDVKSVLDRMRQHGFGVDDDTYEQTLRIEGEWLTP